MGFEMRSKIILISVMIFVLTVSVATATYSVISGQMEFSMTEKKEDSDKGRTKTEYKNNKGKKIKPKKIDKKSKKGYSYEEYIKNKMT